MADCVYKNKEEICENPDDIRLNCSCWPSSECYEDDLSEYEAVKKMEL